MIHETPRARRHATTRARILEAAADQLGATGAVTLSEIAASVDLTPAALYRYFPSKEDILYEVASIHVARQAARLAEAATDVPAHPDPAVYALRRVLAIAAALRIAVLGDPELARIIGRLVGDPETRLPDPVASPLVTTALTALAPLVIALSEAPLDPGDPLQRAITLLAAQQGVLGLAKLQRLTPVIPVADLAAAVPITLLRGWGAPAATLAEASC